MAEGSSAVELAGLIVAIWQFMFSVFVFFTDRPKRGTGVSLTAPAIPATTASVRLVIIVINALMVGGFWGWYVPNIPSSHNLVALVLLLFLSWHWLSFFLAFRAADESKGITRSIVSACLICVVSTLAVPVIYGTEILTADAPSSELSAVGALVCVASPFVFLLVAWTGSLVGRIAIWLNGLLED